MIPEIDKFRSSFKDFARPNRFKIDFENLTFIEVNTIEKFKQLLKNISFWPTITTNVMELKKNGDTITIYDSVSHDNTISCEFIIDEDMTPMYVYNNWINKKIYNMKQNEIYPDNISNDITMKVYQYNIDMKYKLYEYTFFNIKPKSITNILYSHESTTNLLNCNITFTFTHFEWSKL